MKAYDQWVVWKYEQRDGVSKPTKVPYCPRWATKAAVDNPKTWGSFIDALQAYNSGKVDGIGFVLTAEDPFGFVDLDNAWQKNENGVPLHDDPQAVHNVQLKIFNGFDSYAERSPSGEGLHIICKTPNVPNGRKRSSVEVYTSKRFMTMTGEVFHDRPIAERGEVFEILWKELGGPARALNAIGDVEQKQSDEEVLKAARGASNGVKFGDLWDGDWQKYYQSQSEADFAVVDILAFYTQNREQLNRMFRSCALGQRDKAQRDDYMEYMVNKSFDRMLKPIDVDWFKMALDEQIAAVDANGAAEGPTAPASDSGLIAMPGMVNANPPDATPVMTHRTAAVNDVIVPPGLIGEITQYIFETSRRPVMEIALAGALSFMAGIVGRGYNVSGTGLNQYIMLLAPTGTGKEAIAGGVNRLAEAVAWGPEGVSSKGIRNYIGPAEIASGPGLVRWFERSKSFVSILGEIGITLKRLSSQMATSHEKQLLKVWLDLYNKSGAGDMLNPSAYSDSTKNTEAVASPAFSMFGESVPENFYGSLDETMVASGLLPRFTIIEYNGPRPPLNKYNGNAGPSPSLLGNLRALVAKVDGINNAVPHKPINIPFSREADKLLDDFDAYADTQINANQGEVTKQLWNRAHLKAMKLAALVAVGQNWHNPVIDYDAAKWASDFVARDISSLLAKFASGEIGGSIDMQCHNDVIKFINKVVRMSPEEAVAKYKTTPALQSMGVLTLSVISRGVLQRASFRGAKNGSTNALKATLQHMLDCGELRELGSKDKERFNVSSRCFVVNDVSIINDRH
ncbi:DNA primase/helicase [Sphingomonas phage Eidolon]|uniref:DNA primase/helicase n=1 Tax=Sphingomonas phage Eidolon TaxID=2686311 RepID=A0A6M3T7Z2_9CAUD|nr:DNA primase/helicase [Sphingomonas phage Eidolon]QJD54417.1 DNA primase/helicase [Sphingomonas phage Eidolon]